MFLNFVLKIYPHPSIFEIIELPDQNETINVKQYQERDSPMFKALKKELQTTGFLFRRHNRNSCRLYRDVVQNYSVENDNPQKRCLKDAKNMTVNVLHLKFPKILSSSMKSLTYFGVSHSFIQH